MAERGWFLDIVQECVNYEMKVQAVNEQLKKCAEANKALDAQVKTLTKQLAEKKTEEK